MTRLSCHRFRSNEVRLWLSVIAYDLGNLWRRLAKTGGLLVKHARYYWLLLVDRLNAAPVRVHAAADGVAAHAHRVGGPASERISARAQEEEGRVSEESLHGGPVSAFGRLRRGKTVLFSGPFTLRAGGPLHFGRSGGRLSDGPNLIVQIPE